MMFFVMLPVVLIGLWLMELDYRIDAIEKRLSVGGFKKEDREENK